MSKFKSPVTFARAQAALVGLLSRMGGDISRPESLGLVLEGLLREVLQASLVFVCAPPREDGSVERVAGVGDDVPAPMMLTLGSHSAAAAAVRTRTPVILPVLDERSLDQQCLAGLPLSSGMALPLMSGSDALGALEIYSGPHRQPLNAQGLPICQAAACVIALCLDNARLRHRLAQADQLLDDKDIRLFALYEMSRALTDLHDLGSLAALITDMVIEVMDATLAVLFLAGEEGGALTLLGGRYGDPDRAVPSVRLALGDGHPDWVAEFHGEALPLDQLRDPRHRGALPDAYEVLGGLGAQLALPLVFKQQLVGLVAIGKKAVGTPFRGKELEFLGTLAPLVANGIANAELYEMAILDSTTRLYMRRFFRQRCLEEIKRSQRYGEQVSLVMLDIDLFKRVNDAYGHPVGDQVLRELGAILRTHCRGDVDVPARYGGDEFVVLCPETRREDALILAERIRQVVEETRFAGRGIRLTVSVGVATAPEDGQTYTELVAAVDRQLYGAKTGGHNRVSPAQGAPGAASNAPDAGPQG